MISPLAILGMLSSPIGKAALIGLGLVAAVVFIDRRATFRERARCNAAAIQSQLDATRRDLQATKAAYENAQKHTEELEKEKAASDAELQKVKDDVAKLPADKRCTFGDRAR